VFGCGGRVANTFPAKKWQNCWLEIKEVGHSGYVASDRNGNPAGLYNALSEARALSRYSDGAASVHVVCTKTYKFPKKRKGTVTYRGAKKGRSISPVFVCKKGKCSFARGDWAEKLEGRR